MAESIGTLMGRLRRRLRLSQAKVALRVNAVSGATLTRWDISRYERGERIPDVHLPAIAQALGADLRELEVACEVARAARRGVQVTDPAAIENEPGLQFAGDHSPGEEWERMAEMLRRAFLKRGIAAVALPAVGLEELQHVVAALDDARKYADSTLVEYFRRQLDECASQDRSTGPAKSIPGILGLIAAMERMAREAQPVIRVELLRVLARGAELAGWFYRDLAASEPAGYWRDRAMEWAQAAADPAMQGYILLKKSQAAWDERDGLRMLTLAEATANGPWVLPLRVQAEAAQQTARGHAMLGQNGDAVSRELDRARDLLAQDDGQDNLSPHYSAALFELQVANCLSLMGNPDQALALYEKWLTPRTFSRRDYGYFLSSRASAEAKVGDVDAAAGTGITALAIARETSSARTHTAILRLTGELRSHWERPKVAKLREAVLV